MMTVNNGNGHKNGNGHRHDVAIWAGVSAFFGSLLAIGVFDVLNPAQLAEYAGALIVAFITGGAVYSKQRLDDAKAEKAPPPHDK